MNYRIFIVSVAFLALLGGGCAPVKPDEAFSGLREELAGTTDARVEWRGVTAEDAAVDRAVEEMLASELTADRAVQAALLNDRELQATYEDLGIAQADLVQAGLLRNPVFDLTVRWPDESPRKANIELGVVWSFLDVFFIPARKKVAADQFEAARLRVAAAVLETAADVREAFFTLQGRQQLLEARQAEHLAADAGAEAARRLRAAGNITELELAEREAEAAQAQVQLTVAESEVELAREELARRMGVAGELQLRVPPRLPELPGGDVPPLDDLTSAAAERRLDLLAARHEAAGLARAARLNEAARWFEDVEAGVEAEREVEGTWLVGPTVAAPVPLFDQGQASLARARAQFRQARHRYAARRNEVRSEVRTARARLSAARARAEHYRDVVLPLRERVVEQTQLEYNAMLVGVFELLQARRDQIEASREYVEALQDYWIARSELERAVGGRLPETTSTTRPATTPAPVTVPAPATPDQHHHHGG